MMGNLPFFVGTIGGAVVFAVLFSVVNTMLMSARQRSQESGILKALGFPDTTLGLLMLGESVALTLLAGGAGVALALLSAPAMRRSFGSNLPGYDVLPATALMGLGVALCIGLAAGIAPALLTARLDPVEALRSEG
jgi:putative ABC transport system permease protein